MHETAATEAMSAVRSTGVCAVRTKRQKQEGVVVDRVWQREVPNCANAKDAVAQFGGDTVEPKGW